MTDPLARLAAAGFPLEHLGPEERDVLGALSAPELELLVELKQRLDEVGPEVQAHSEIAGGALF